MVATSASFLARKALNQAKPFIRKATNEIKKEGFKQVGNLQQARQKCQRELQQCIKRETTEMKKELGGIIEKAGTNMQSGGRRRSRKRKRSRKQTRKRKRSRKHTRKRKRSRTRKRRHR